MGYLNVLYKFFLPLLQFLCICMLISSLQWFMLVTYNYYCLDGSMFGFITNMITLGSPICIALNKIQSCLSDYYITYIGVGIIALTSWIGNTLRISE